MLRRMAVWLMLALRRKGIVVGRRLSPHRAEGRRASLLKHFGISLVLDVGANLGQYAHELRETGYRGWIVSLEPLDGAFRQLQASAGRDARWVAERIGLGDVAGEATIHVAGNLVSSSLLEQRPQLTAAAPEAATVRTERISLDTLDRVMARHRDKGANVLLKLDTQGFELRILRGAGPALDGLLGVQVEVALVPTYQGQPGWREVVDFLEQRGFELWGLEPGFADPATGRLLELDAMFFRSTRQSPPRSPPG